MTNFLFFILFAIGLIMIKLLLYHFFYFLFTIINKKELKVKSLSERYSLEKDYEFYSFIMSLFIVIFFIIIVYFNYPKYERSIIFAYSAAALFLTFKKELYE